MTQEVPLTQGKVALVDDDEYERVMRFKWCAVRNGNHWYAKRLIISDGKSFNVYLHRFIMGLPDGIQVDHRNGDGLDCTKANMRVASERQNVLNSRVARNNVTGYKGVSPTRARTYQAKIVVLGQVRALGTYLTPDAAARVYDAAARHWFGDFAWTNFAELDQEAAAIVARIAAGAKPPRVGPRNRAVLSPEQVSAIRHAYAPHKRNGTAIAKQFGVSNATVYQILSGRTWKESA